jgi:hypothetical protein
MPRRRPVHMRADQRPRQLITASDISRIPGLSRRGQYQLAVLEATCLTPGHVQWCLRIWKRFLTEPAHRQWEPGHEGCGYPDCCADYAEVRAVLESVPRHLPARDARLFRRLVAEIDRDW